jgi:hypothetical protein
MRKIKRDCGQYSRPTHNFNTQSELIEHVANIHSDANVCDKTVGGNATLNGMEIMLNRIARTPTARKQLIFTS